MKTKSRKIKSQKATDDSRKRAIPQVLSRRRSLPALAKLHERVLTALEEAQDKRDLARKDGLTFLECIRQERVYALAEVQLMIVEAMSEEPEGNTD